MLDRAPRPYLASLRCEWHRVDLHGEDNHAICSYDILKQHRNLFPERIVAFHVTAEHARFLWNCEYDDIAGFIEVFRTSYAWRTGNRLRNKRLHSRRRTQLHALITEFDALGRDPDGQVRAAGFWPSPDDLDTPIGAFPIDGKLLHLDPLHYPDPMGLLAESDAAVPLCECREILPEFFAAWGPF